MRSKAAALLGASAPERIGEVRGGFGAAKSMPGWKLTRVSRHLEVTCVYQSQSPHC
jgi:hypothetical protein